MARPSRHPKTGVYWLRKAVPEALRPRVGKRELVRSLRTKDPREAARLAPAVLAEFNAILADAQAEPASLSLRDLTALAGEWYRAEVARWGNNPDDFGDFAIYRDVLSDQVETEDGPDGDVIVRLGPQDLQDAAQLLKRHGYPPIVSPCSALPAPS